MADQPAAKPTLNTILQEGAGKLAADAIAAIEANPTSPDGLNTLKKLLGLPVPAPSAVPPPPVVALVAPAANAAQAQPTAPATLQGWLQTAPPEVQRLVGNAMQQEENRKKKCIEIIRAKDPLLNADYLNRLPPDQLLMMAKLAMPKQPQPTSPANNYAGQGEPPMYLAPTAEQIQNASTGDSMSLEDEILTLPVLNYALPQKTA